MPKSALVAVELERENCWPPSWLPEWALPAGYLSAGMRPAAVAWQALRRNRDLGEAWAELQGLRNDRWRADAFSASEGQRFGVERLVDPAGTAVPVFLRSCARVEYAFPGSDRPSLRNGADGGHVWIQLDATLPTAEQLESACAWFSGWAAAWHREHPRQITRRLPSLDGINLALRARDGELTGAKPSEIGRALFTTSYELRSGTLSPARATSVRKQAVRALTTATWLIDEGGYLEVAMREQYRPEVDDIAPPA
ncbi:MAG TPA: hypothetical protein VGQ96_02890 [Candidatus Eremiobacteraceae bacterium]|nr:hypothetical protein [Candidatus Eremiobacteraceae bacterium]